MGGTWGDGEFELAAAYNHIPSFNTRSSQLSPFASPRGVPNGLPSAAPSRPPPPRLHRNHRRALFASIGAEPKLTWSVHATRARNSGMSHDGERYLGRGRRSGVREL